MSNTNDPMHKSPHPQATEATKCLGCGEIFQSKNKKTNRMCSRCRKRTSGRRNSGFNIPSSKKSFHD